VTFSDRPAGTEPDAGTPQRPEDILGQERPQEAHPDSSRRDPG
jgi:hypothetical protein